MSVALSKRARDEYHHGLFYIKVICKFKVRIFSPYASTCGNYNPYPLTTWRTETIPNTWVLYHPLLQWHPKYTGIPGSMMRK